MFLRLFNVGLIAATPALLQLRMNSVREFKLE